ncbi:MAG: hypothetical protein Q9208_006735 [Pyrenodesmia sp. 3 TL-2023]
MGFLPPSWRRRKQPRTDNASMTTPTLSEEYPRTNNAQPFGETFPEAGDGNSNRTGAAVVSKSHSPASIYKFKGVVIQAEIHRAADLATQIRMQDAKPTQSSFVRRLQNFRFSCKVIMKPLYGSYNILIPIRFRDRLQWLLKLPANGCHDQWDGKSAKALISEALTMKFIYHNSSVPVPRIYSFDSTPDNPVKCPYILMEKVGGKSLYYGWYHKSPAAKDRFRELALESIAKAMVQLGTFTFSSAGALQLDDEGNISVGPYRKVDHFAAHDRLRLGQEAMTTFSQQGPFSNPKEYFLASLNSEDPSILPHQQQGHRKLLRLFIDWFFQATSEHNASEDSAGFVLSHPDFNLQNILVGDHGTLRGLVDWDGVAVVPRCLGYDEYPLWLTRDWDPHYWDYDGENGCPVDPEKAVMTPVELAHWRTVYARAIQTAAKGTSMSCPTATKLSPLARCLYIAANEPLTLQYNVALIFEKIVDLTAGDQFEEESIEPDHEATIDPSGCEGNPYYSLPHNEDFSDLEKDAEADEDHLLSHQNAIDHPVAPLPLTVDISPTFLVNAQSAIPDIETAINSHGSDVKTDTEQLMAGLTTNGFPESEICSQNSTAVHWLSKLLIWQFIITYHLLKLSAQSVLLMGRLQPSLNSSLILIAAGFLFSDTPILSSLVAMLLGGLLLTCVIDKALNQALGGGKVGSFDRFPQASYDQAFTSEKSEPLHSAQDRGFSTAVAPLHFSAEIEHAGVSPEGDNRSQEGTVRTISPDMCEPTATIGHPKEPNYKNSYHNSADLSESSKASASSEESSSNSTHTDMEIHSNYAGNDAQSGGEQDNDDDDDDISINSDDMLDIIMKKWDEDPTFDFGTFGQRNVYNALYNTGTLDRARMRRLKIGFQRLLASLDDRYADFDGLVLRDV